MKACIFIFICINFYFFSIAQNGDTIFWSANKKLKIEDFKATPDTINKKTVKGYSMLSSPISCKNKRDTVFIIIQSCFIPKESFFISDKKNNSIADKNLLLHEQGHFDIQEIELRKFQQKLIKLSIINFNNFKILYKNLLNEFLSNKEKMQKLYDTETDYSNNKQIQKEWGLKISKELKGLSEYSNHSIKIPFTKSK